MNLYIFFYIFSILIIIGSLFVILSNNPVQSVMAKFFTFLMMAAIWITLEEEYLALILIIVYVGAVLVMFLFVMMMVNVQINKEKRMFLYWPIVIISSVILSSLISRFSYNGFKNKDWIINKYILFGNAKDLGMEIFSNQYLYAFELSGIILFIGMISTIALTLRGKQIGNKSISPSKQVKVQSKDRLIIINNLNNK